MVDAQVHYINVKLYTPEHTYDEESWRYVAVRIYDVASGSLQFLSGSFMSVVIRTMEVALGNCCAYG